MATPTAHTWSGVPRNAATSGGRLARVNAPIAACSDRSLEWRTFATWAARSKEVIDEANAEDDGQESEHDRHGDEKGALLGRPGESKARGGNIDPAAARGLSTRVKPANQPYKEEHCPEREIDILACEARIVQEGRRESQQAGENKTGGTAKLATQQKWQRDQRSATDSRVHPRGGLTWPPKEEIHQRITMKLVGAMHHRIIRCIAQRGLRP